MQPVGPDDLAPLFPMELILQEVSTDRYIDIPGAVLDVYRLSRLYDRLSERSALVMLAAWRGSTMAVARAKYRSSLYDDERHRVRAASSPTRPAIQPGSTPGIRNQKSGS